MESNMLQISVVILQLPLPLPLRFRRVSEGQRCGERAIAISRMSSCNISLKGARELRRYIATIHASSSRLAIYR
jgi:hypothetical protein